MKLGTFLSFFCAMGLVVSCAEPNSGGTAGTSSPGPERPLDEGTSVQLELKSALLPRLSGSLEDAKRHDAASLKQAYAVPFATGLTYDPAQARGLDLIQRSALQLNDEELALLKSAGFVIAKSYQFPTFAYGYTTVYAEDLPVFVSADMVLEALHHSYDDILMALEREVLVPRVSRLLSTMREKLRGGVLQGEVARDVDLYLAVATSLLTGTAAAPVTDLAQAQVVTLVDGANSASGERRLTLFGVPRLIDFSQFKPRGHYDGDAVLERYFRAMMWMGRIDFRLIETQPDGARVFWRRQLEAAFGMRALMDAAALEDWRVVDRTIGAFVGEHDYMHLGELEPLLTQVGVTSVAELAGVDDGRIAQAIIDGRYGEQRILSHIVRKSGGEATLPLNASFAFFGQRYVVDSHVFSNVVYDRVATRVVPNPLDAAFAALGNDHAVALLATELETHPYAGDLAAMRQLVDSYDASYWNGSLYTSWLGALRSLSPSAAGAEPGAEGLPTVARTEPWQRRVLNTQLASWAELRHDTILYAKQSYTTGTSCEFPDAYVEPYPEFFKSVARFAELGSTLVPEVESAGATGGTATAITDYFTRLRAIALRLAEMAELQRTGQPHTAEHVAFINQAIRIEGLGSGDPWQTGWYKDLFFDPAAGLQFSPTIADVHTDPGGNRPVLRPPSVLHVGTGRPRLMVMTVDSCQGPRAYAGIVFAYHEHLASGLTRLTDREWSSSLIAQPPAEVPWMSSVVAP